MHFRPRQKLRDFYDQALLSQDLLCMNCAHTTWESSGKSCSPKKRQDCHLFVSDMIKQLALRLNQQPVRPGSRPSPRP